MWKNKCGWGRQSTIGYVPQEDCDGAALQVLQRVLRSNGEEYILEWVRRGWGERLEGMYLR